MSPAPWSWACTALSLVSDVEVGGGGGLLCVACIPLFPGGGVSRLRRSESGSDIGLGWVESERELHFVVCVLSEASEERAEAVSGLIRVLVSGGMALESSNAARAGETDPGGAVAERWRVVGLFKERGEGMRFAGLEDGKREKEGDCGWWVGDVAGRVCRRKVLSGFGSLDCYMLVSFHMQEMF